MRRATRFCLMAGLLVVLGGASCATPSPGPEVGWENGANPDADLERDRAACLGAAAAAAPTTKRFDSVARGSRFMRCMNSRGWHQVAVDS